MLSQANKAKILMVVAFLATQADVLGAEFISAVNAGKVNPRDTTLVVRAEVTPGGTVNLLESLKTKVRGANDFDGDELSNGRHFVIDAFTINYGVAASDSAVHTVNYTTALPPALKASNFAIGQTDVNLRRFSVAAVNEAKSTDYRYYQLESFVVLKASTSTQLDIEFPTGSSDFAAGEGNSGYVEVILKGFETNIVR